MAEGRHSLGRGFLPTPLHLRRKRWGRVGTAQITPPLPKKYAGPLKGGLAFSFSGTGKIFENASKFISRPAEPADITEPRRGEGNPASGKGNPALATNHNEVRTSPTRLAAVWYPVMSEVRQLPEFKKLVAELNLVEYWRAYGWADACRPLGDNHFTCM